MNEKLTILYLRVSTLDQIGGAESQARALTDWCFKNSITNYEIFADHGISGAKESRPSLNRLMDRVKEGTVCQVVVFAFSRFARSTTHLLRALEFFRSHNVRFQSVTENLDTSSPMGIALFTLTGESTPERTHRDGAPLTISIKFDSAHLGPARLEQSVAL